MGKVKQKFLDIDAGRSSSKKNKDFLETTNLRVKEMKLELHKLGDYIRRRQESNFSYNTNGSDLKKRKNEYPIVMENNRAIMSKIVHLVGMLTTVTQQQQKTLKMTWTKNSKSYQNCQKITTAAATTTGSF
jgi:hypothetical protein